MRLISIISDQIFKQEAFEKCWAHSPLRPTARPFTRCRYWRRLRIDVHNNADDNDDDDNDNNDNDNAWQKGPLWPHGMGPIRLGLVGLWFGLYAGHSGIEAACWAYGRKCQPIIAENRGRWTQVYVAFVRRAETSRWLRGFCHLVSQFEFTKTRQTNTRGTLIICFPLA